mmetsp:Transcript_2623/g.8314  ORF Transcript_2623/g.8314 Transcript_2623/m.8314 type:complete len:412 (-) Transcript_2623:141-1376(-)
MRAAKVIVTQRRAVEAGRARAMEAVRKAAAGYLKSVESAADAERRRAKDAAAAMLQGAVRGRKARRHAAVLAALPSDPTVIIHSVAFDGVALSTFHQLWFAVELGNEGLLRQTTKVRQPQKGRTEVRFEETFFIELVRGESLRTADRLRELLRETSDDDNVEMDLVFTLFGKDGTRPVQALGEAYVNLKEMAISGSDLAPPDVLEILNTQDKVVGRLSVSVTALEAFKKLSEGQSKPTPPPEPAKSQALPEPTEAHRKDKAAGSPVSKKDKPTGETVGVVVQPSEPRMENEWDPRHAAPPKQVTIDSLLEGSGPPSPDLPLDARHTEADFEEKERKGPRWDNAGGVPDVDLDDHSRHGKAIRMAPGSEELIDPIAALASAGADHDAAACAAAAQRQEGQDEDDVGDFELDA